MKKILSLTLISMVTSGALYAGEFEKKFEMMYSRIKNKMEKYVGNQVAQDFLNKKLSCVKASKTLDDLKACKKKYHPKSLKKLVK